MPGKSPTKAAKFAVFISCLTLFTAFSSASEEGITSSAWSRHSSSGPDQAAAIANLNEPSSLKQQPGLLNPDGTINLATNVRGAFDVSGWTMAIKPNGEPRFFQAAEQHS